MSHDEHRSLDEFEAQLAALRPAPSGVDRERIAYGIGHTEGAREVLRGLHDERWLRAWFWPLATALSLLAAATFAMLWQREAGRPALVQAPAPVEREAVSTPVPEIEDAAPMTFALASESYLHLRQVALSEGVDALPQRLPTGGSAQPPTARSLSLGDS